MATSRVIALAYYTGILLLLYLPIGVLFLFSVNDGVALVFPMKGVTGHWYADMLKNKSLLEATRNSALVALGSSTIATALGAAAAIAMTRFNLPGKAGFIAVALSPLLAPFLILGVALLILFAALDIPRSLVTIGIGHVVIEMPYTLLIIMARMAGFNPHLEEAAQDLGATYPLILRRIILPIIAPAVVAAWLVGFTVSFDEFVLASFLNGGNATLPVYIFGQLRFANRFPQVVALAVAVMALSLALIVVAESLQRAGSEAGLERRIGREGGT